jgi:general secretion pathway protein C
VQKSRIIVLSGGQQVALDIPNESMPSGVQTVRSAPSQTGMRKPLIQINPRFPLPTANLRKKSDNDSEDVPDVNVEDEGENRYGLQRDELKDALSHSAELFTQIHAIPNIQNGKGSGFTLQEIEPGSVFEDLGLEDGDQLTAIDGRQLENPAEAVGLLSTIQTRSAVDITVMRDGHPVQLHYDIH